MDKYANHYGKTQYRAPQNVFFIASIVFVYTTTFFAVETPTPPGNLKSLAATYHKSFAFYVNMDISVYLSKKLS